LLGVALHAGTSFPVGQVEFLHLEPLDFEEFLLANGEGKLVELYKADPKQIFDQTLSEYLKYYFFTGGMPAVVQSWITEKNVEKVETLQEEILRSYLFDFSKHTDSAITRKINQIRKAIPKQFAKENDKFMRGLVREGARAREYELALQWIIDSGVGRKVPRVKRGDKLPLLAYKEDSAFKLYFLDVGLLRKLANIPSKVVLGKEAIFYEFNGMLAEQFVLQNMADYQLFYRTSGANAEVDFVVQFEDSILPIEVKSGENTQSKSLKVYREKYQPKMSIRFSLKKYIVQD
jgi:predicted AAA+ superfamily ATPase